VSDDEQIEVTFLVGEWMPASDLVEMLRREQEQDREAPEPEGEGD
jgi:hypothetical protein